MLSYAARHEAHLPTAQHSQGAYSRLSRAHVDAGRPEGAAESASQGSQAPGAEDLQEVGPLALGFGRTRRLRKHAEFVRAQKSGRRVGTPHFTLLVACQPPPPRPARLGLVVARSVGTAVRRNRVKRLCRECFRISIGWLPDGVDLVVIARPGADELGLADVQAEWRAAQPLLKKRAAEALTLLKRPNPKHPDH